ncbi:Leucine-rich repeat,Leucine-rich repeat domain, L domain-like [Cinara cedri]|uniref:Dynein axonemal assembly factor 1 homolog n=1 Tax=Cinara cedri TaxID=506608 RepID=A0A5E4M4E8_9HEMI|nr:Leucine-rich repeat,Leucine-rich repeat domain, L domain-like [Cinara cedri]
MEITEEFGGDHNTACHKPRITKESLKDLCKQKKLYIIPSHNDVLYLHFKGYLKIENLEEYTGLKCLWLENNCISTISGLDSQKELVSLYMHHNAISKIENLDVLVNLHTINLSHNFIKTIENLDTLPVLNTLIISHNKFSKANDIVHLANCKTLSILDLSHNYLDDPEIVEIFSKMESLRVLTLTGNSVISKIKYYRKTLTLKCKELRYLDERPIFKKDRMCAEAWSTGGTEAEQAMRTKLNEEDQKNILDSVNTLMGLRRRKEHIQITPAGDTTDNLDGVNNDKHTTVTDTVIVSKDYYEEHDSSDESTDESVKSTSDSEDYSDHLERSQKRQLQQLSTRTIVEIDGCNVVHGVDDRQTVNNHLSDGKNGSIINNEVNEFDNSVRSEKDSNTDVVLINENNENEDNSLIQNQQQNTDITITNSALSNVNNFEKCKIEDIIVKQSTGASGSDSSLSLVQTGKTSKVLCTKGLHSFEIIPNTDDELGLPTVTAITEPDPNTEELSICLPWKQFYLNEDEYYIKKMSE